MNADFVIRQGDSASSLADVLRDADGNSVDIAGATITLRLIPLRGGEPLVDAEANNDQDGGGAEGAVSYDWGDGETDTPGFYLGSWAVEFAGGDTQTFPNDGFVLVHITPQPPEALGTLYVTVEELKGTLRLQGYSYADEDVSVALEAACRGIDEATGRHFYPGSEDADEVRYYSPDRPALLEIDDLLELEELALDRSGDGDFDDVWTLNEDFVLEPLNAANDGKPWEIVHARRRLPVGVPRSVRVTGRFGWLEPPAAVRSLTSIIAAKLLRRAREAPFGVFAINAETAAFIARTDPEVEFLLHSVSRERVVA